METNDQHPIFAPLSFKYSHVESACQRGSGKIYVSSKQIYSILSCQGLNGLCDPNPVFKCM